MVHTLQPIEFSVHAAVVLVPTTLVIGKRRVRVMELVSRAARIPRIVVVDRIIGKLFPPSRSAVHDHIARKINSRGIGDPAEFMERIRYSPGRTYVAAVDERPSVREVRDTLAAEIAGVPRAARRPLGSVNVTAAPTSLAARTVVEVEVPLVGVLKAKAESEWVRSASGPGSDQIARRSARTV